MADKRFMNYFLGIINIIVAMSLFLYSKGGSIANGTFVGMVMPFFWVALTGFQIAVNKVNWSYGLFLILFPFAFIYYIRILLVFYSF